MILIMLFSLKKELAPTCCHKSMMWEKVYQYYIFAFFKSVKILYTKVSNYFTILRNTTNSMTLQVYPALKT